MMRVVLLFSFYIAAFLAKHHKRRAPIIDLHGADQLVANIREDENVLSTVPDLSIVAETDSLFHPYVAFRLRCSRCDNATRPQGKFEELAE
ncbi:hypothetical protein RB195_018823 [Necator americanus]|uniref:Uncharacterized protein n=1 Tax=Necator americanus TaxID=51031 RepID=A0ABR1CCM8_NECAM